MRPLGKGQISADAMAVSVAVLILFLFLFGIFAEQVNGLVRVEGRMSSERLAGGVASAINAVERGGNGTHAQFILPESLDSGADYNLSISPQRRSVIVQWIAGNGTRVSSAALLTMEVQGKNFTKGAGTGVTYVNFTNVNGVVNVAP